MCNVTKNNLKMSPWTLRSHLFPCCYQVPSLLLMQASGMSLTLDGTMPCMSMTPPQVSDAFYQSRSEALIV